MKIFYIISFAALLLGITPVSGTDLVIKRLNETKEQKDARENMAKTKEIILTNQILSKNELFIFTYHLSE